ncbi:mitochondrial phosphate carrier protein [Savitreella phatthalungensis]
MSKAEAANGVSFGDFTKLFVAGGLACTLTHGAATPIDVVKTTIQVDNSFKGLNMVAAGRKIIAEQGTKGLMTGFGPTAAGYLVQGGLKFSCLAVFRAKAVEYSGGLEQAAHHRTAIYLGTAALAEFIADIALCPLEATRIRLVSQRGYATGLTTGFLRLAREEGMRGFYSGFTPLVAKQVPYAVGQFCVMDAYKAYVYGSLISPERRAQLSTLQSTGIELVGGLIAGAAAAILSHPADTLLSAINKGAGDPNQSATTKLFTLATEFGPKRLLVTGLGPRLVMTMFLVSGQFLLYSKVATAVGASPGVEIPDVKQAAK